MQGVGASQLLSRGRLYRPHRLVVMAGIGLLIVYLLNWSGIVQTLELVTYDLRLWLRGPQLPSPLIVLVAINDESFNVLNQNIRTWRQSDYAHLLETLAAGQPAVVGLDVVLVQVSPEPDSDVILAGALQPGGQGGPG